MFKIRKAKLKDQAEIEWLIAQSVRGLSRDDYSTQQIEISIKTVFGIDIELIRDKTFFVVESEGEIVGCGGWSKRKTLYGASRFTKSRDSVELNPLTDPAKIRAFFIHPDWARKGIGTMLLEKCETEAKSFGFQAAELMATLPGVKLYSVRGYEKIEDSEIEISDGFRMKLVMMRKKLV